MQHAGCSKHEKSDFPLPLAILMLSPIEYVKDLLSLSYQKACYVIQSDLGLLLESKIVESVTSSQVYLH